MKLASNENPLGISHLVREKRLTPKDFSLARPTQMPYGFYLKQALADKFGIAMNQINLRQWFQPTSLNCLHTRTYVTAEHEVIFAQHAFVVYPLVTKLSAAKPVIAVAQRKTYGHDLDAMCYYVFGRYYAKKRGCIFVA